MDFSLHGDEKIKDTIINLHPTVTGKIHQDFLKYKDFVLELPIRFHQMGTVIQNHRNILKHIVLPEGEFVVKNFKGMYMMNRLAYSFFRKSKAERSYVFSEMLNQHGIGTPKPVAWMDIYRRGILVDSYFISSYDNKKILRQVLETYRTEGYKSERIQLLQDIAEFALNLHKKGIFHDDFGVGNILVNKLEERNTFSLLDLNRIQLGQVSFKKGLRNFNKLHLDPQDMNIIITKYAKLCNRPPERAIRTFWQDFNRFNLLINLRRKLRKYTLTPLEMLFKN